MKAIILLFTMMTFSSCSLGELGYHFGDWLIKREILGYVKLYQGQQEKLELELDNFMVWHEKVMMPLYISDLKKLENDVVTFPISEAQKLVESTFLLVRKRYVKSFIPLALKVAPILSSLNDEQVQRTREIIAKKFKKQMMIKPPAEEIRKDLRANLEQWLGSLTKEQAAWLTKNQGRIMDSNKRKIEIAKKGYRRKSYLDIFDFESEKERTKVQLEYWEAYRLDFLKVGEHEGMIKVISELVVLITPGQRLHLQGKLAGYRRVIEGIID